MSTVALDTVKQETSALAETVAALVVHDTASYQTAGAWLVKVKGHRKRIKEFFAPILRSAKEALDTARAQETSLDQPAADMELLLKRKMEEYDRAERERAEAERRRVAEEQRRAQAEADRIAREETERRETEAALARSLDAEAQGVAVEDVQAVPVVPVIAAPVFVPPAIVTAPPKADGVSMRELWGAEVIDFLALVRAVADGKADQGLLLPNTTELNRIARSLKGSMSIPGVKAVSTRVVAAKAS
jgi:hypothetical protein